MTKGRRCSRDSSVERCTRDGAGAQAAEQEPTASSDVSDLWDDMPQGPVSSPLHGPVRPSGGWRPPLASHGSHTDGGSRLGLFSSEALEKTRDLLESPFPPALERKP
ncbi:Protein Prrc2A [Manis pentadactyla]|nr:Protein Prrc2A [Manis pentadactyla]